MLNLIQADTVVSVSARAVLKDKFADPADKVERPVILEGLVRDVFFGADGKLLYLVFDSFNVSNADGSMTSGLNALSRDGFTSADDQPISDQLVIEGDRITMVRYFRRALPVDRINTLQ